MWNSQSTEFLDSGLIISQYTLNIFFFIFNASGFEASNWNFFQSFNSIPNKDMLSVIYESEGQKFLLCASQDILYTLRGQHEIWHTVFSVWIHEMFRLSVKK